MIHDYYEDIVITGTRWNHSDVLINPLNASPTKWSNTLKQFVGKLPPNCLSVFDHFGGLELKGLKITGFRFQGDTS